MSGDPVRRQLANAVSPPRPSGAGAGASWPELALSSVYEISKLLATPGSLETTLSGVLALLHGSLDMHNGLIALLDPAGTPDLVVAAGKDEAAARRDFARIPERAIGQIVVTRQPLVVENMAEAPLFAGPDFASGRLARRSSPFVGVPIKGRDKVIGLLTIERMDQRKAEDLAKDARFLGMVADLVGQSVCLRQHIATDRDRLIAEQRRLSRALKVNGAGERAAAPCLGRLVPEIVGDSNAIRSVLEKLRIVARSHSTVLLRGESGTGKELFARALHDLSPRRDGAFVKLNCAALPESVLESELFGHERGAFTDAISQHKGRFERADGGTLFLDEIGEISPAFQAKLLRVLQEGEFERVGGSQTIKVNVRLVTATNRNLEEAVCRGAFRADLYYRICVVPILLPPLRDRPSDVALLAQAFLGRFNAENATHLVLEDTALAVLKSCHFPGNVRELENCIRRTATLAQGNTIRGDDLACRTNDCLSAMLWRTARKQEQGAGERVLPFVNPRAERMAAGGDGPAPWPGPCLPDQERRSLIEAMETAGWVQAKAARLLGLSARQMGYALRKHNIPLKKF